MDQNGNTRENIEEEHVEQGSYNEGTNENEGIQAVTNLPVVTPHACVNNTNLHGGHLTIICVKSPSVDEYVSESILKTGAWEGNIVNMVLKAMHLYKDAVLLDLGSNIGMYSLAVAGMNRRAVAVDALIENLAYIRHSLVMAGRVSLVDLVARPVSDKKELLYPVTDNKRNEGGTRLVTRDLLGTKEPSGPPVQTATLRDLLLFTNTSTVILKIDIEGMECRALQPKAFSSGSKIFVPYILMEWMHVSVNFGGNCPLLNDLVGRLLRDGYRPWAVDTGQPLPTEQEPTTWGQHTDLVWQHNTAPRIL